MTFVKTVNGATLIQFSCSTSQFNSSKLQLCQWSKRWVNGEKKLIFYSDVLRRKKRRTLKKPLMRTLWSYWRHLITHNASVLKWRETNRFIGLVRRSITHSLGGSVFTWLPSAECLLLLIIRFPLDIIQMQHISATTGKRNKMCPPLLSIMWSPRLAAVDSR